jgi:hypothetical protein
MVQPIIVQGDDGENPASFELPEDLVDEAYSRAKIDFVFFEPIYYNSTLARDGEISLNQIVENANDNQLIRGNGDIVNMFFVNKVDGKSGPLGRGLLEGSITFIALGDSDAEDQKFMEAFVIAHEVGHNLGLIHAVDDPNVPDSIPNIQGDGTYEERINPISSLNDYQIEKIYTSPLVVRKIDFLSKERGEIGIIDESFEPYFSLLQEREIYAFTKEWIKEENIDDSRELARQKFQSAVTDFSAKEMECIQFVIQNIDSILKKHNIDFFEDHAWRFIKVDDWLCGGFAHTRGTYTILSQKYLDRYTSIFHTNMSPLEKQFLITHLGGLLIHEQVHALQRTHPSTFADLYSNYWSFEKITDQPSLPTLIENQLLNPDAPNSDWMYRQGKKLFWIRVLLNEESENPRMGADFVSVVYRVKRENEGYKLVLDKNDEPRTLTMEEFKKYTKSFPTSQGLDHPNEISAYMMADYFKALCNNEAPFLDCPKPAGLTTELFLDWFGSRSNTVQP